MKFIQVVRDGRPILVNPLHIIKVQPTVMGDGLTNPKQTVIHTHNSKIYVDESFQDVSLKISAASWGED